MEKDKSMIGAVRDLIVVLREAIIIIVVLLLFLSPSLIKDTLTAAGFTKASFGGWEWQKEVMAAKQQVEKAKGQLAEVQERFVHVNTELEQIKANVRPEERVRIAKLSEDIELSREKTDAIQSELSLTIQKQDNLLHSIETRKPIERTR